ncbi:MAG TPA: RNA polymerase sigma factor [Streptosporangiaceae bacterium]|nr:RNA polymerase sigma factor [Streptosporangiaceae bacterium]
MGAEGDEFDDVLARARSGDERAFLQLWERLHPRLLRYLRVLGCDEADDVASETWLQAVRDLDRFDGGAGDFRCWLFTIGRHRAVDASRTRIRSRIRLLTAALAPRADPNPVEDEVLDGWSTQQAVALVARLPRDQAEAVALRVIAGLDTAAVAGILGKSPGAVRIALHRGLRTLAADPRIAGLQEVDQ